MNDLVFIQDQQALTTSLIVAEKFEKEHKNVIRDIRRLDAQVRGMLKFEHTPSVQIFTPFEMFIESTYVNEQNGQSYPMYYLNRDGFTLLAMGFDGEKALKFKLDYIAAFNAMEYALQFKASKLSLKQHLDYLLKIARTTKDANLRESSLQKAAFLVTGEDFPLTFEFPVPKKRRRPNAKFTEEQVAEIRQLYASGNYTQNDLADMFNVGRTTIHNIVSNSYYQ